MSKIKEIICVELVNNIIDEYKYKALMGFNKDSYILFCSACKDENLESILSDKTRILSDATNSSRELVKYKQILESDNIKTMGWVYSRVENLPKDIKTVSIQGNIDDIQYFVKHNEMLKDKEIIIGNNLALNDEMVNKLNYYFGKYDNVLYMIEGNTLPITMEEYKATLLYINNIVNMVKRYNYSPLEKLIYAYDIIRSREYHDVDNINKYYYSRDLTGACLGEDIVCFGFARILREVLNKLNISTINIYLNATFKKPNHVRNLIYLNDTTYNVNGFYELDTTFDCKKPDSNYLLSYHYFLKTIKEMADSDNKNNYLNSFKTIDERVIIDYQQYLSDGILTDNIKRIEESIIMFSILQGIDINLASDNANNLDLLINYKNLLNRPLDNRVFLDALNNVITNEYYGAYSYGFKEFYYILRNSNFKFINGFNIEKLGNDKNDYIKGWLDSYINNHAMQRIMTGQKLTKCLKRYALNRIDK